MGRLNASYGSELHLLRMLGRHRKFFDAKVRAVTGADAVEWCDFPSGKRRRDKQGNILWDREWRRLDFLPEQDPAREAWRKDWPTSGEAHNWDAIAEIERNGKREWLLVETEANVEELRSSCGAENEDSLDIIRRTLDTTKNALAVPASRDWLSPYYQYCNRLAALRHLTNSGSAARLLFIYFCGDRGTEDHEAGRWRRTCPRSEME